jgi:hypothetical protein
VPYDSRCRKPFGTGGTRGRPDEFETRPVGGSGLFGPFVRPRTHESCLRDPRDPYSHHRTLPRRGQDYLSGAVGPNAAETRSREETTELSQGKTSPGLAD